jgi:hypothetical protein
MPGGRFALGLPALSLRFGVPSLLVHVLRSSSSGLRPGDSGDEIAAGESDILGETEGNQNQLVVLLRSARPAGVCFCPFTGDLGRGWQSRLVPGAIALFAGKNERASMRAQSEMHAPCGELSWSVRDCSACQYASKRPI